MSLKYYSVTAALNPFSDFSRIDPDVLKAAAYRGTKVHAAAAAYVQGLWVAPLHPDHRGYFDSFRDWFDKYVSKVFMVEKRLYDHTYCYTGRVDLVAELTDGRVPVVDFKTSAAAYPTYAAQTAAYFHLVKKTMKPTGSMCLLLRGDGGPAKGISYPEVDRDFAAFLSALNSYRYFNA